MVLCAICNNIEFRPSGLKSYLLFNSGGNSESPGDGLELPFTYLHHKTFAALTASAYAGCHLCTLVRRAILGRPLHTAMPVSYNPAIDDEQIVLGLDSLKPDERIFIRHGCERYYQRWLESKILPEPLATILSADNLLRSENLVEIPPNSRYVGKQISDDKTTASPISLQLAAGWLQTCEQRHTTCPSKQVSGPNLPTRVISVYGRSDSENPFLYLSEGRRANYIALSYRWGNIQKALLTVSNLEKLCQVLPLESLPLTFRDAIDVTKRLGIRYLWIDALCIIQDSDQDKQKEIGSMAAIYQNATVTIAAANGDSADSGLFAERNPTEYRPCQIQRKIRGEEPIHLSSFATTVESKKSTPLDERGWILQEELLSPRTLIFGSQYLSWSCTSTWACESDPIGERRGHYFKNRDHFRSWLHASWFRSKHPAAQGPRNRNLHWQGWYSAIENYTSRKLTVSSDRLPGVSGIASLTSLLCERERNLGQMQLVNMPGMLGHTPGMGMPMMGMGMPMSSEMTGKMGGMTAAMAGATGGGVFAGIMATLAPDKDGKATPKSRMKKRDLPYKRPNFFGGSISDHIASLLPDDFDTADPSTQHDDTECHTPKTLPTKPTYLAGLWEEDLEFGLLWFVSGTSDEKPCASKKEYLAPSWSWASLSNAAVKFADVDIYSHIGYSKIQIEEAGCKQSEGYLDPFGEVVSGFLTVRGPVKKFVIQNSFDVFWDHFEPKTYSTIPLWDIWDLGIKKPTALFYQIADLNAPEQRYGVGYLALDSLDLAPRNNIISCLLCWVNESNGSMTSEKGWDCPGQTIGIALTPAENGREGEMRRIGLFIASGPVWYKNFRTGKGSTEYMETVKII